MSRSKPALHLDPLAEKAITCCIRPRSLPQLRFSPVSSPLLWYARTARLILFGFLHLPIDWSYCTSAVRMSAAAAGSEVTSYLANYLSHC